MHKFNSAGFASLVFAAVVVPHSVWAACGEILVSKGDIKVESAGKTAAAPQGTKVCQGDTVIAGAQSRAKVKMEDGNELNISPDSRIKLETYEYKPADNKKKVMLNVLYGKVRAATREENMYNDKATDGQANTFQVKTKSAVAGVRGTDFLTSFDRKTTKTEVVTFKGTVQVGLPGANGSILNAVMVGAGQRTEAILGAPPAPPKTASPNEMKDEASNGDKAGSKNSMARNDDLGTAPPADSRNPANEGGPQAPGAPPPPPPPPPKPPIVFQPPPTPPPVPTPPPGPAKVNVIIQIPVATPH